MKKLIVIAAIAAGFGMAGCDQKQASATEKTAPEKGSIVTKAKKKAEALVNATEKAGARACDKAEDIKQDIKKDLDK